MEYLYLIIILVIISSLIIILYLNKYYKKKINKINEEYYTKDRTELENIFKEEYNKKALEIDYLNKIIDTQNRNIEEQVKVKEKEVDRYIEERKNNKKKEITREISEWEESAQEAANEYFNMQTHSLRTKLNGLQEAYNQLYSEVEDYRSQQQIINEDIKRRKELEEKQSFYMIQVDERSQRDLELLAQIRPNLSKLEIFDKVLYDNYVKKPVDEMEKRVLNGKAVSGIYKITRLKTGEVYIGKSTDVKARWQQHAKSCFHCGTISHSILHTTMEKDGIWNFTWELLEEVPKEKLGEREKFWIEFFDTKRYGLNERVG